MADGAAAIGSPGTFEEGMFDATTRFVCLSLASSLDSVCLCTKKLACSHVVYVNAMCL